MVNGTDDSAANGGWMADVQRALAIILLGTLCFDVIIISIRLVIWGDAPTLVDMLKTLIAALINMGTFVLGYFFGSSKAKEQSDAGQQKVIEKLTGQNPPGGPVAPVPQAVVVPWWTVLTEAERTAIEAEAANDPRTQAFIVLAKAGRATPDDLTYLVGKGLLAQDRAATILAS